MGLLRCATSVKLGNNMATTVKARLGALRREIKKMKKGYNDAVRTVVIPYAEALVRVSPVYTGAYVESFSIIKNTGGGGRSVSQADKGNNKSGSPESNKAKAISQMRGDINRIAAGNGVKIVNKSPHVALVEKKHAVFQTARGLMGSSRGKK